MERYFAPQKAACGNRFTATVSGRWNGRTGWATMACLSWAAAIGMTVSAPWAPAAGESVFVALFLAMTLEAFAPVCGGEGISSWLQSCVSGQNS